MDTPDPTRANAFLWAHYVDQQWGPMLTRLGGTMASGMIGAAIANMYAAAWGDVISSLFESNLHPAVHAAQPRIDDTSLSAPVVLPQPVEQDIVPPWLGVAPAEIEAPRHEREPLPV